MHIKIYVSESYIRNFKCWYQLTVLEWLHSVVGYGLDTLKAVYCKQYMKLDNWAEKWWHFWLVLGGAQVVSSPGNWLYWLRIFVFIISHGAVARIEPPIRAWVLPSTSFTINYWLNVLLELGQYTDQATDRIFVKLLLHSHWGEQIFSSRYPDWGWGLCNGGWGSFPGVRGLRNEADNSLHLVPKWRMIGIITSLPHMPSWHTQKKTLLL